MLSLLSLLSLTALGAHAQSSGTFTLSTTSGCIVLSQVATLTTPYSLTQSRPICPGSGVSINWPLTSGGNGAASSLAIYAGFQGTAPGCVMPLSQMQAMYILGRTLEWRADGVWDFTANGLLRDPTNFEVLTCHSDNTYLPGGFKLPDPGSNAPGEQSWTESYTLEVNGGWKGDTPQPKPVSSAAASPTSAAPPPPPPPPPPPSPSLTKDSSIITTAEVKTDREKSTATMTAVGSLTGNNGTPLVEHPPDTSVISTPISTKGTEPSVAVSKESAVPVDTTKVAMTGERGSAVPVDATSAATTHAVAIGQGTSPVSSLASGAATGKATSVVASQVASQVTTALMGPATNQAMSQPTTQVTSQAASQVTSQLISQATGQVVSKVESQAASPATGPATGQATGAATGTATGAATGTATGAATGTATGAATTQATDQAKDPKTSAQNTLPSSNLAISSIGTATSARPSRLSNTKPIALQTDTKAGASVQSTGFLSSNTVRSPTSTGPEGYNPQPVVNPAPTTVLAVSPSPSLPTSRKSRAPSPPSVVTLQTSAQAPTDHWTGTEPSVVTTVDAGKHAHTATVVDFTDASIPPSPKPTRDTMVNTTPTTKPRNTLKATLKPPNTQQSPPSPRPVESSIAVPPPPPPPPPPTPSPSPTATANEPIFFDGSTTIGQFHLSSAAPMANANPLTAPILAVLPRATAPLSPPQAGRKAIQGTDEATTPRKGAALTEEDAQEEGDAPISALSAFEPFKLLVGEEPSHSGRPHAPNPAAHSHGQGSLSTKSSESPKQEATSHGKKGSEANPPLFQGTDPVVEQGPSAERPSDLCKL